MANKLSQQTVKNLIIEASSPACPKARLEEIRGELFRAVYVPPSHKGIMYAHDGSYGCLVRTLFVQTTRDNPSKLIHLLPLFLMMCGDGEYEDENIFAKIDWSIVE